MTAPPKGPDRPGRKPLLLALKLGVTAAAFAYLLSRQSLAELGSALRAVSPAALGAVAALQLLAIAVGTVRWRALMRGYGATRLPPIPYLYRIYLVGYFYNTYLPFAVGGDVMRGVVSKEAFGTGGIAKGVAVVFVERALGLSAVLGLTAAAVLLDSEARFEPQVVAYCGVGLVAVAAVIGLLAQGNRIAPYLPSFLGSALTALPSLRRPLLFGWGALLSALGQLLVVVSGFVLVRSLWPASTFQESLLAMPLSAAAAFFPLSVAGIGARDVVLVALYELLGVPPAAATATAIAYLGVSLFVAGLGGLAQLVAPLKASAVDPPAP